MAEDAPRATPVRPVEREGARLVVLTGPGEGRKYPVHESVLIGRSADCDVVLVDDSEASRRHARVARTGPGTYGVVDLGSRNGTWVNGSRAVRDRSHALRFGDRLLVGRTAFELVPYDKVEELLRQRQRLETLGRLGAGISHDFNNLVGAIVAAVAYLRALGPEARVAELDECLADVDLAARRAAQLARRLIAFGRTEDDGAATTAVEEAVGEVVTLARRTFERRIEVAIDATMGLSVAMPSPALHQVLMNLCLNARDAIMERRGHGRIEVRAHPRGVDRVVIEVEDDGSGMDEARLARVFEPFFTTKGDAGFGLGLATVWDLVRAHGGTVAATSRPGSGSTFTIVLPAARAVEVADESPAAPIDADDARVGAGARVLVVDDEALVRRTLARVLARAGFEVDHVATGEAALDVLSEADVVLLDLDLPGMGGEETLRRIRAQRPVPVVCVTGHLDPERERVVRALGATDFLTKPCEPHRLVATLGAAVRHDRPPPFVDDPTQYGP